MSKSYLNHNFFRIVPAMSTDNIATNFIHILLIRCLGLLLFFGLYSELDAMNMDMVQMNTFRESALFS
jgi:hypothetical protein